MLHAIGLFIVLCMGASMLEDHIKDIVRKEQKK